MFASLQDSSGAMAVVGAAAAAAALEGNAAGVGRYFCFQQFPYLVFDKEGFIA